MVGPLVIAGLAGLGVSAGANLYTQYNQRKLYAQQVNAYKALHDGYETYLNKHGRSINPNRAWTSYFGQYQKAQYNLDNSYYGSIGTLGGSLGAGSAISSGLFRNNGRTSRRL